MNKNFLAGSALLAAAALLAACAGEDAVPDGRPAADRTASLTGPVWPEDAIVGVSGGAGWAQEVIADFRRVTAVDAPARIETLDTSSCIMNKPAAGDLVRHLIVGRGAGAAPLYQIDDGARGPDAAADQMRIVNVVITEKKAPVHLVLASETNVIWNLLLADGAQLSAIALISGGGAGVVGAPADVDIEALYGEALTRCAVTPARRPQGDWVLARRAAKAKGPDREAVERRRTAADAYDAWFAKWYGEAPDTLTLAVQEIGAALIGPAPAAKTARVGFRPIAGATLKLSLADRLIIGGPRDYEAAVARGPGAAGS